MVGIGLLLHALLGPEEMLTNHFSHEGSVTEPTGDVSNKLLISWTDAEVSWGITIEYLKKGAL